MAIPVNARRAPPPVASGIIVGVTPSTNQNVYLELARATASGGTYRTIMRIPSIVQQWTYTDELPVDNIYRYYKARHTGPGYADGSYTGVVAAKPVLFSGGGIPSYAPPIQDEPVASTGGITRTLTFGGNQYDSADEDIVNYGRNEIGLFANSSLTRDWYFTYPLSLGTRLVTFKAFVRRPSTNDAIVLRLKSVTASTALATTTLVTFTATAGAGKVYTSSTFTAQQITTGSLIVGHLQMNRRSTAGGPHAFPAVYYTQLGVTFPHANAGLR